MPRLGRLHIPGGCYHVMGRGLERRRIFGSSEDKEDFLERLGSALAKVQAQCLAWAVMPNHYHLLVQVGTELLSYLMSPLLSGYASAYNRRHKRSGYVFQNRYKSILCDADAYLLQLVRYIHLNPLKANIVDSLARLNTYPWTGHATLMGKSHCAWQETATVFKLFGEGTVRTLRNRYHKFLAEDVAASVSHNLSGGGLIRSY
ncbi:MAG: transposase [Pseudomonadota bacterium]